MRSATATLSGIAIAGRGVMRVRAVAILGVLPTLPSTLTGDVVGLLAITVRTGNHPKRTNHSMIMSTSSPDSDILGSDG